MGDHDLFKIGILRFADALPGMRRITSNHLRHKNLNPKKVLAAMRRANIEIWRHESHPSQDP